MSSYRISEVGDSSWSNRMRKRDQKIAHLKKTIEWLSVLNQETNGVYDASIQYVISYIHYEQYLMGAINIKKLIGAIKMLQNNDRRYLEREITKHTLAVRFAGLYNLYKQYKKRR